MRALISTEEAAELLDSGAVVVLDVRWRLTGPPGRADYDLAHLPGAVFVDLETELAGPPSAAQGRHPLPEPERLAGVLRTAGVSQGVPVIVYDDADGSVAARAWWLLRWLGHPDVAVLDGGFAAWRAEDRPLTADVPRPAPGNLQPNPGQMPTTDADGAAAFADRGVLLDARAPERYRGEVEPVDARAGHIPGAHNSPAADNVTADAQDGTKHWRTTADLAAHFAGLGVAPETEVGVYCGSGVTACAVVLAIEHAGVSARPATLYPGSFSQWSADKDREVATG